MMMKECLTLNERLTLTQNYNNTMSEENIEVRVKEIIAKQLGVNEEQVTPEASFLDDLGADSLDLVELIMTFEEEFEDEINGEIPESDAEKLLTVSDVIGYVSEKSGGAGKSQKNKEDK